MKRSYSLDEVAAAHLPTEWVDPPRWLRIRLNRGELTGFRLGRVWRMTDDDVDFLITKHRNIIQSASTEAASDSASTSGDLMSFADGLSKRSRGRLKKVS